MEQRFPGRLQIRLTEQEETQVNELAHTKFDGNRSMAGRYVLRLGLSELLRRFAEGRQEEQHRQAQAQGG